MKISQMISLLTEAMNLHGDLPVSTDNGFISILDVSPITDGIDYMGSDKIPEPNELYLEFQCR